ncbi:MAG: GNAT family N-acetyltransferase [Novosphingobium sp.]|uniref:GNAT family N-acetyltransferase n=1 Tax=Novosphingobium sp. TaxID=1874826 RepID=UPI0017A1663F|nr:GNAT family N-acetyltransferase [Novosphingobium sp.]
MDRQPILEDDRLLLRPLAADDWDALHAVAGDPQVWALHPVSTRWQEPVFRAFFDEALREGGALIAIDKVSGKVAGSSQFRGYDPQASQVEIGWTFLGRDHWGGAANRAMKRLMLTHALQAVERAVFRVGETNLRSRRAMEKIGGRLTDERETVAGPNGPIVHVVYEITRAGFAAGPLSQS